MKKVIKVLIVILLIGFLIVSGISLYIGNYLYDYTLNPHANRSIVDVIQINEEVAQESRQWLDDMGEEVSIMSHDNINLRGYSIQQESSIYVIMVHGYRSDGASLIAPIKKMYKQGYNLLIPDLRGHGLSEGDYIGMGWDDRLDVLLWIDSIIKQDKNASIVLYGVSMGGATVMNVAGEMLPTQVKAIIEDCGYTNVWEVFQKQLDMDYLKSEISLHIASVVTKMRAGYFLEDNKPIEQVKKSQTPMLFIHGDKDEFVPYEMLDQLYNAATCEKEKLVIKNATHTNSCSVDPDLYYQTVFRFIDKYAWAPE